jgi:hypothetical protein
MRADLFSVRPDLRRAQTVDQGIALIATHGRAVASAFLVGANVPFSVIARVLSEPPSRRRAGPRH